MKKLLCLLLLMCVLILMFSCINVIRTWELRAWELTDSCFVGDKGGEVLLFTNRDKGVYFVKHKYGIDYGYFDVFRHDCVVVSRLGKNVVPFKYDGKNLIDSTRDGEVYKRVDISPKEFFGIK